jgi:CheY-like chemotaxis protein
MDSLQRGQPAALLCLDSDNARGLAQGALQRMGYAVDMPTVVDQALQRLRFNQYQVIVLAEQFGGSSPNPVTEYVTALNMNIRRDIFVALVGERFKTADHLQAFVESVNLVLHPADLTQIQAFLARGLRDHERFYKVFVDCLIESGRRF